MSAAIQWDIADDVTRDQHSEPGVFQEGCMTLLCYFVSRRCPYTKGVWLLSNRTLGHWVCTYGFMMYFRPLCLFSPCKEIMYEMFRILPRIKPQLGGIDVSVHERS